MATLHKLVSRYLSRNCFGINYTTNTLSKLLAEIELLPEKEKVKNVQYISTITDLDLRIRNPHVLAPDIGNAKKIIVSIMKQTLPPRVPMKTTIFDQINTFSKRPETTFQQGKETNIEKEERIKREKERWDELIWANKLNIKNEDLYVISDAKLTLLYDIIISLTSNFESTIMYSELNNIVSTYIMLISEITSSPQKQVNEKVYSILMEIFQKYGWDNNNFNMPPNRKKNREK